MAEELEAGDHDPQAIAAIVTQHLQHAMADIQAAKSGVAAAPPVQGGTNTTGG
jgi:hypothetical protein